ncbi:MAG TPA: TRAP transporter permease DctM/Q, partial [Candidatus Atribacteria bacterium]|nr:TRAP transporter permease DctM/Q [Candidatus Atribacteria bacterium]
MKNKKIDYILLTRDILSFIFVIFHLYLVFSGLIPNIIQRSIHIALSLPLIFLYFPPKKKKITLIVDIIFSILSFSSAIYISLFYEKITYQYGIMEGKIQEILAIIIIIMVLEGARRSVKPALPIIATLFLLYAFFGHLLPGYFGHVKFEPASILGMLYLTTNGIWGIIVGISVNIIAIFVILGAMLVVGG